VLLALAGFASQAQVRVTDSLLPQIAADFDASVGAAAIVVTAYAVAHGSTQLLIGPLGDRFGKYLTITLTAAVSAILVMICGLAQSLPALAIARLLAGAAAGWVIPLRYLCRRRRPTSAGSRCSPAISRGRFSASCSGGAGGVLGDLFGRRNVFFLLGGLFAFAAAALVFELITNPAARAPGRPEETSRGFVPDYVAVLSNPFARIVLLAVLIEAAFGWGAFAFVGADLHQRFGLGFSAVGLIVGTFAVGGLLYASTVAQLVNLFDSAGSPSAAASCAASRISCWPRGAWWLPPIAVTMIGLGFYALHNTLQTNATQMTPEARGTAVAIFSSVIYLAQTAGVTVGR
jgi:predicted MFS family arabinose efflux permease